MKAFLLTAGYGERLRPITDRVPKPLVPVLNVPAVCYALTLLKEAGVTEVVCNLHHLPAQIEAFFRCRGGFGMNVSFSHEPAILGTGGGPGQLPGACLTAGPSCTSTATSSRTSISGIWQPRLNEARAGGVLAVRRTEAGRGRVTVRDGRVVNLRNILPGTPPPDHDFLGVAVLSPADLRLPCRSAFPISWKPGFISLARDGALLCREYGGIWHDIGTIESYRAANIELLDMDEGYAGRVRAATGLGPSVVSGGATIGTGARRQALGHR